MIVGDPGHPAIQALVRWDQAGFADRELTERAALRLPPEARMASLTGSADALAGFLAVAQLPTGAEVLGPVAAGEDQERFLVRAPGHAWATTVAALKAAAGVRSAHKESGSVRLQVDPLEIA